VEKKCESVRGLPINWIHKFRYEPSQRVKETDRLQAWEALIPGLQGRQEDIF
jgi:hypothetical protein